MTLPRNPNRQPQGVPTGGQFATSTHGEPQVNITAARGQHGAAEIKEATSILKQRRENAWPEAAARFDEEEGAWAASNAAVAVREMYEDAAVIEYDVDSDGRIVELDVLDKNGHTIGTTWRTELGRSSSREWLDDRVSSHLDGRNLKDMATQGAGITDKIFTTMPDLAPGKTVRLELDDVIMNAHDVHTGGNPASGPFKIQAASQDLQLRRTDAFNDAKKRHVRDEQEWAASRAALSAREIYPEADEIEYDATSEGRITELAVMRGGEPIGVIALNADASSARKLRDKSDSLRGPVLFTLQDAGLESVEGQGAEIQDDLYVTEDAGERGKTVRFKLDDVIVKAAGRVREQ